MAITTNTTKSVSKSSTVLNTKCEDTIKNMAKMMKDAGCEGAKKVKTLIPNIPGSKDDVVMVGLNGISFYFMRGKSADIPEPILEIMQNCNLI